MCRKFVAVFVSVILFLGSFTFTAKAENKSGVDAYYDESYLFIQAEKYSGVDNWYAMAIYSMEIKSSGGKLSIQVEPADDQMLKIHNQNGYAIISEASGNYSYQSGAGHWEIRIPLDILEKDSGNGNINIKMDWAGGNHVEKTARYESGSSDSSGSEPDSSGPGSGEPGAPNGIVIDGYYDDWEGIPPTIFTHHGYNNKTKHKVSVVKDDTYIYVHVKLSEYYNQQIPINAMYFDIEGKGIIQVCLRFTNNPFFEFGLYTLKPGRHGELSPFLVGRWSDLGEAYVTIPDEGNTDQMEYRINIEKLEKVMHWPKGTINNCGKITVTMPNLGDQKIVVTGTSTAPYVGVAISLAALISIFAFRTYRRKKVRL